MDVTVRLMERLSKCPTDEKGQPLTCYGCAHSASGDEFPGYPSGERPCMFCVRNPQREEWQEGFADLHGKYLDTWYDGTKVKKLPMDCYITVDRLSEMRDWPDNEVAIMRVVNIAKLKRLVGLSKKK